MCPKFKLMPHDEMVSTLKGNHMCLNCFGLGHGVRQCKSSYKCKKCQKPHHTLLHVDKDIGPSSSVESSDPPTAVKLRSSSLLMTCTVLVFTPDGSSVEARALIDNSSTSSFISERLAQSLQLRHSHQNISVSGIAGSMHNSSLQSVAQLQISSAYSRNGRKIDLTAVILPKATCNLPVVPIPFDPSSSVYLWLTQHLGNPDGLTSYSESTSLLTSSSVASGLDSLVCLSLTRLNLDGYSVAVALTPLRTSIYMLWLSMHPLCVATTCFGDFGR